MHCVPFVLALWFGFELRRARGHGFVGRPTRRNRSLWWPGFDALNALKLNPRFHFTAVRPLPRPVGRTTRFAKPQPESVNAGIATPCRFSPVHFVVRLCGAAVGPRLWAAPVRPTWADSGTLCQECFGWLVALTHVRYHVFTVANPLGCLSRSHLSTIAPVLLGGIPSCLVLLILWT